MSDGLPQNSPLTLEQRFPLMTPESRALYEWMHEQEAAPRYNHRCGDRLDGNGLTRVREWAATQASNPPCWRPNEPPDWVAGFVERALRVTPHYRAPEYQPWRDRGISDNTPFSGLPTIDRADLSRAPWEFVPDDASLADLIVYNSSGTTGHPLDLPCHHETASMYLPLAEAALREYGITLERGNRVAMLLVCAQSFTYTFAVVSAYLEGAAFAKINLNPVDWRSPDDRQAFLDACDPQVYTGDPISLAELATIPLKTRPRALISTALALSEGLRRRLEEHFQCPVIDIYSMIEAGNVAVALPGDRAERRYAVLPHDLYVEVVDASGAPLPAGEVGEVTLTGGRNPYLPLVRYRTGDFAALEYEGGRPTLTRLQGRPPTRYRASDGGVVNNIDISWALQPYPLEQFAVHQFADGSLRLRLRGHFLDIESIRRSILRLFGESTPLEVEEIPTVAAWSGKIIQYTSDIPDDL